MVFTVTQASQIVCMVTIMHVTCTQTALHVQENLCTVLIPLCIESANLPHKPLCFKETKANTTKALLISSTVVPNPYSHSTTINPQPFDPLP